MKALLNVNCGRSLVSPYRVVSLRLFKRQNNALFPPFVSDPDQDVINENHTPNYSYDHYPSSRQLVPTNNVNPSTPPSITNESADPERGNIDVILRNRMITRHIRMGDLDSALRLFNNMDVKSTVTWNSLLAGYSKQRGKLVEARQLFDKIPKPDIISYNTLLSCFVRSSDLNAAKTFFDQMPIRDTASWNTMITGFADKGMMSEALSLFMEMPVRNSVSWNAMISGYIESGDLDSALKMFRDAPIRNEVAWTAIISGYMKSGEVDIAEKYYEQMRVKSLVTYNCMISGYVSNCRAEDGLKLFRRMVGCGIRPNPSTMSSVLLGCSCLSALSLGTQIHPFLYKSLLYHDTTVGTSLLSMYCKCGVLEDAWKLFLEMPRWDLATWNAIISGYAHHGAGKRALSLFDQMKVEKVEPDWITFVGVLAACNHAGLVDVGVHYFETMGRDHGIETKPEHYTCMVDLLGRAGKLNEAVDLVKKMPIEPSAATLGALLSACRIHKNLELAEFAAKRLVDLNPSNSAAAYVQLSNLYRTMNRWDQTATLHKHMRRSKLEKIPGYSWIEIKSVVHEFTSGDTLHPDMPSIHRKLQELEQKMILAGYKPDLECVLHDVDEKQKKELLLCHSEKLAIAFGVMRLPQGSPIRIFKNLRVCADCHNATKYISAIEGREIIVRDSRRFHHFSNGSCSCGDYW